MDGTMMFSPSLYVPSGAVKLGGGRTGALGSTKAGTCGGCLGGGGGGMGTGMGGKDVGADMMPYDPLLYAREMSVVFGFLSIIDLLNLSARFHLPLCMSSWHSDIHTTAATSLQHKQYHVAPSLKITRV